MRCPYQPCGFDGTEDEVEDHIAYLQRIGDDEHDHEKHPEVNEKHPDHKEPNS